MNYSLKEDNDSKLSHKDEKYKVIDLKDHMEKKILKIATLKISARLNMHWLIEENDEALNASKENGTTKRIEELNKLHQILEDKEDETTEITEEQDMLREQLKALQQSFN